MASSDDLLKALMQSAGNPMQMTRVMLDLVEGITKGNHVILDPTNPAVYLLEASATCAAAALVGAEIQNRKTYPSVAMLESELYTHMSDLDYVGRFGSPSTAPVSLILLVDDLLRRAVDVPNELGVRKITIPRNTVIDVADMNFTTQYPIDIRILSNKNVNVTYDMSNPSPVQTLTTNIVPWVIGRIDENRRIMRIDFDVPQVQVTTQTMSLTTITGFKQTYAFVDNFYLCRAYVKNTSGVWVEIRTTHSDLVYDPTVPTVVFRVVGQTLQVYIPEIYYTNGLLRDQIRLDIHTTKGALDFDLSGYAVDAFKLSYVNKDDVADSIYSAPLLSFSAVSVYSSGRAFGGSEPISVIKLREQVVRERRSPDGIPITDRHIETLLNDQGYSITKTIDDISNLEFLATKPLPTDRNGSVVSAMGATVSTVSTRLSDFIQTAQVASNDSRIVVTPKTLFVNDNGIVSVVDKAFVDTQLNKQVVGADVVANRVNQNDYLFSPFTYILDTSADFSVRAYELDKPAVVSKFYMDSNAGLQVPVATQSVAVVKNETQGNYTVQIVVDASDAWKAFGLDRVGVQLSFVTPDLNERVSFNGVLVSPIDNATQLPVGDYVYEFYIPTYYDVNQEHRLIVGNNEDAMSLTTSFDLVYFVKNHLPAGATGSDIDALLLNPVFTDGSVGGVVYGIVHESVTIRFGDYLDKLWQRFRPVVGDLIYQRYLSDVPAFYPETVYQTTAEGDLDIQIDPDTGDVVYVVLHNAGDPIIGEDGQQAVLHYAGDIIYDQNQEPMLQNGVRGLVYTWDMVMLDGAYYFADETFSASYLNDAIDHIKTNVVDGLDDIAGRLLSPCKLMYHPQITVGMVDAIADGGLQVSLDAKQTLDIIAYVNERIDKNADLKLAIRRTILQAVSNALSSKTVSTQSIEAAIKTAVGIDLISVFVSGFAKNKYQLITLMDGSAYTSIGRRLAVRSNLTLGVEDAINIEFQLHA